MILLFNKETKETIEVFYGESALEKLKAFKRWRSISTYFEYNPLGQETKINVKYVCEPWFGYPETYDKLIFP